MVRGRRQPSEEDLEGFTSPVSVAPWRPGTTVVQARGALMYNGLMYNGLMYNGLMYNGLMYNGRMYNGLMYIGLMYIGLMYIGLMCIGLMYDGQHCLCLGWGACVWRRGGGP
jgi:hypothetical protein